MSDMPDRPDAGPHGPDADRTAAALARRAREFQVLQRASSDITSTLDLEEIFDAALRTMDELFEFHHAVILLVEPGGEMLRVVASRGYENQATGGRVPVGTGVVGLVAQKRKMLYVSNLGQQRMYAAAQRRQMVKTGRGAELPDAMAVPGLPNAESQFAIPLMMRDELVGVFSIESPVKRTFSEHERGLVSIVANQIASAIHNARLFEERELAAAALRAANVSLETRVAERTAALERELRIAEALLNEARSRVEGPLLGDSAAVRALRDAVAREAHRSGPLLLVGPPGSGKDAVAHALHETSGRTGAFIAVNCPELHATHPQASIDTGSALAPEALLLANRMELAAGGTLFLDAVHELPSEFHPALRQILERQAGEPSGRGQPPSVRVVASTTRDMSRDPQSGRLDALFQLLSASRIVVPALADRREDIPAIVRHFVQRHARQLGKTITGVSEESMRRLEAYLWPGNIQELRTVIERAILVARGGVIEIEEELLNEGLAVGSYRLVSPLGAGGMGEVWLGKHRLLARPAAVKLIRHDSSRGPQQERLVRRFQREAQVTAGLRSPHTVQLYDFGVNDSGSFYYVMELLNGLDLHKIVTRFGPQPAERVIALLRQACRSLAEAHDRGLVHRDIKPANLFVTRLGPEYDYLKVLDFGIVKDQPEQDSTTLSGQHLVQGTPAFMAPELIVGDPVDGRADLYSLGCTAFWALTGQSVFQANTAAQMLLHHVQTTPGPTSAASELPIPPALDDLVAVCLQKEPTRRIASALALDAELARVPVERPWTQERAREWWEMHAPELLE
jgi:DNA-binding NtrC family response regulator/putative methionine-R-sulfoxide reductase with GAF domain